MFEVSRSDDLPIVGQQTTYLTGHDELHSLSQHLDVPTIRFWMGFGEHYINVFNVLRNLGLLSEKPVRLDDGREVVPLQLVKAVLPDPASLAPGYVGKTCIGNLVKGTKDGQSREVFIYNVCDHVEAFAEVGSQAISYTAGVPAAAAALLIANGAWDVQRMANVEELPCKPFIELLNQIGLPTQVRELGQGGEDMLLQFDEQTA
jgi:saccharopine dehydrogenase-like NADP-dependent oxidoreductase